MLQALIAHVQQPQVVCRPIRRVAAQQRQIARIAQQARLDAPDEVAEGRFAQPEVHAQTGLRVVVIMIPQHQQYPIGQRQLTGTSRLGFVRLGRLQRIDHLLEGFRTHTADAAEGLTRLVLQLFISHNAWPEGERLLFQEV